MDTPDRHVREAARRALERLDGEDATLLALRFIHAVPYRGMAAILGIAEPTARVRVHRALERARRMARGPQVDERALTTALAAVAPFALPKPTVDTAVNAAVHAARSAASGARMPGRPASVLRSVLLAGAVGLVALLAVVAWRARASDEQVRDESIQTEDRLRAPTLRGRSSGSEPALAHAATREATAPPQGHASNPPKVGTSPGQSSTAARPASPGLTPIAVRMELVALDGSTEEVEIETVSHKAHVYEGRALREHPGLLRTRPGWRILLETKDPRVATPIVILRVPDPVPEVLVASVPSVGDPRLGRLTLEVVDGPTGEPLPNAVLHRGAGESEHAIVRADGDGRIVVPAPTHDRRSSVGQVALLRFASQEWTVHAPGHINVGWVWGTRELVPAVAAEDLATWLEKGTKRISLPRLPHATNLKERAVRILDAEGRPVSGAYVRVAYPVKDNTGAPLQRELGVDGGFRRTDEGGLLQFPMGDVVALSVSKQRVQVAAWGLSKDTWPGRGPRELRMPVVTLAKVIVTGLPEGPCGTWMRDPAGPWHKSGVGPLLSGAVDGAAARFLKANNATFFMPDFLRGSLSGPDTSIRLPLTVGRTAVTHLRVGQETRLLEIRPMRRDPQIIRRRWEDLPEQR